MPIGRGLISRARILSLMRLWILSGRHFQVISEGPGWLLSSLLDGGEIDQIVAEISDLDEAKDDKLSIPLWKGTDSR